MQDSFEKPRGAECQREIAEEIEPARLADQSESRKDPHRHREHEDSGLRYVIASDPHVDLVLLSFHRWRP